MVSFITDEEIERRKKKNEPIPLCRCEEDYLELSKIGFEEYTKKYPQRLEEATYSSKIKLK